MSWADRPVAQLLAGGTAQFRPHGSSMLPYIRSGQLVTVEPRDHDKIKRGDVVLCRVNGKQYLHFVVGRAGPRFLIANAAGHENGWTTTVYGVVTKVDP